MEGLSRTNLPNDNTMVISKLIRTAKLNYHSSTLRVPRLAGQHWDCNWTPSLIRRPDQPPQGSPTAMITKSESKESQLFLINLAVRRIIGFHQAWFYSLSCSCSEGQRGVVSSLSLRLNINVKLSCVISVGILSQTFVHTYDMYFHLSNVSLFCHWNSLGCL